MERKITQNAAKRHKIETGDPAADLTTALKKLARELGFSHIGIVPAARDDSFPLQLADWLDQGYHASMEWMAKRQRERSDLFEYFPEAKTVMSVAINYFSPSADGETPFKISNYALGEDYHEVLKKRLFQLLALIREFDPEVKSRVCVDTSPVPDKLWAQRAGLGWIGKNTNLITREMGSWLFLGELIIDIPLRYDETEVNDYCGSCQACIDACPTQALVAPYLLDARKCISYLTIEHRGEVPESLADKFEGWIYGCDICQQVCPWNIKFHQASDDPAFQPRQGILDFLQSCELPLAEMSFKKLFKGNPLKRTGVQRMERNIRAVLKVLDANSGNR